MQAVMMRRPNKIEMSWINGRFLEKSNKTSAAGAISDIARMRRGLPPVSPNAIAPAIAKKLNSKL